MNDLIQTAPKNETKCGTVQKQLRHAIKFEVLSEKELRRELSKDARREEMVRTRYPRKYEV